MNSKQIIPEWMKHLERKGWILGQSCMIWQATSRFSWVLLHRNWRKKENKTNCAVNTCQWLVQTSWSKHLFSDTTRTLVSADSRTPLETARASCTHVHLFRRQPAPFQMRLCPLQVVRNSTRLSSGESAAHSVHRQDSTCVCRRMCA